MVLMLNLINECKQIDYTDSHHCDSTSLSHSITAEAHDKGEYRSTEQAHNHKTGYLVLQ